MNLVSYLKDIYGYDTPIFLKDIRIGGKSKTAIKEAFSRMVKKGELNRDGSGVYSLVNKTNELLGAVTFEKIVEKKFLYNNPQILENLDICRIGYYSGMTFLNMIGISEQVPAVLEITTNNTSSKKRMYRCLGREAIIRKGRIEISLFNWKELQFFDMFYFLSLDEVKKNRDLIRKYIIDNKFSKEGLDKYLEYYSDETYKKIVEGGLLDAFS